MNKELQEDDKILSYWRGPITISFQIIMNVWTQLWGSLCIMSLLMINEVEHGFNFEASLWLKRLNDAEHQLVVCLSELIKSSIDSDLSCHVLYLVAILFFSLVNDNPNPLLLNQQDCFYTHHKPNQTKWHDRWLQPQS